MGTNYYWHKEAQCPECGHLNDGYHIGKSSAGWCFGLQAFPSESTIDWDLEERGFTIDSLLDWIREWRKYPLGIILDEYGVECSEIFMLKNITRTGYTGKQCTMSEGELQSNHAVYAPNGLLRHQINGWHCVGHGKGNWDMIVGDFS